MTVSRALPALEVTTLNSKLTLSSEFKAPNSIGVGYRFLPSTSLPYNEVLNNLLSFMDTPFTLGITLTYCSPLVREITPAPAAGFLRVKLSKKYKPYPSSGISILAEPEI